MPNFSIGALVATVAALAVSLGLLRNPTASEAMLADAFLAVAIVSAICLVIGSGQPIRSIGLGFCVASIATLWINHGETPRNWGFQPLSLHFAGWADGYLEWSAPIGKAGSTEYYVDGSDLRAYRFDGNGRLAHEWRIPIKSASDVQLSQATLRLEDWPPWRSKRAFELIVARLSALFLGLLGGWIACAARRHVMRTASTQQPVG